MESDEFRRFLRKKGKKKHVVDYLIKLVEDFEDYLIQNHKSSPDKVIKQDIEKYLEINRKKKNFSDKQVLRSLALYFIFISNSELAKYCGSLRNKKTAKTRRVFKLSQFMGINKSYAKKLKEYGIENVEQMLDQARTPEQRNEISKETKIPMEDIMEFLKLSDLTRLGAVKAIRARLYYDAGIDSIEKMSEWNPEELRQMLIKFIKQTNFKGIPPTPKEAANTVKNAKKLKKIIHTE